MDVYAVRERIKKENNNFMNLPFLMTALSRKVCKLFKR